MHYYGLTDEQLKNLENCLDITVRQVGLKGAVAILDLVRAFQNPITLPEEEKQEKTEPEQA